MVSSASRFRCSPIWSFGRHERRPETRVTEVTGRGGRSCYSDAVAQQGIRTEVGTMADDRDARIAQLEAELATSRAREAALAAEAEHRDLALREALEHQTATADVLRTIASSPTNLLDVLQAIID